MFFITFLRALAACLITNSHYTGVYPSDIIANGGLIGDIIFFAVSGYCLYNVRHSFPRWYGKRIVRCYLPVFLITAVYIALGAYSLSSGSVFGYFVYPTNYHFVASIIVLYIPFFFVMKIDVLKKHILWVMGAVFAAFVIVYFVFYDRSYYHIDAVQEPMIRFLFFESMLLGAFFRQNDKRYRNDFKWWVPVAFVISCGVYFASKILFSRRSALSGLQILNQLVIFSLLYFAFRLFASLDSALERMPSYAKKIVTYVSEITLEIYVVQFVIIEAIRPHLTFPLNWFAITASILAAATLLHYAVRGILALYSMTEKKVRLAYVNRKSRTDK